MQHRFRGDKGFSPSGTMYSSRDMGRAPKVPPVAGLPCPFLEKARQQKQGISLCQTQAEEAVLRNGKSSSEKCVSPDLAGAALLRSAEMTNYSTPRHMKRKN